MSNRVINSRNHFFFNNLLYMNINATANTIRYTVNDLYKLTEPCIYAIKSDESKKVYVGYSKNLLTSLGRILGDVESYGSLKDDLSTATIEVLCTDALILKDVKLTRFNVSLYAEQYINSGYTFYKPTNLVKYKLDVKIYANNYAAYYVVDLVNSRNEKILVGVFDKKSQCDSFLALYYPDNIVRHFYTANNPLTKKWRDLYDNQDVPTELVRVE